MKTSSVVGVGLGLAVLGVGGYFGWRAWSRSRRNKATVDYLMTDSGRKAIGVLSELLKRRTAGVSV